MSQPEHFKHTLFGLPSPDAVRAARERSAPHAPEHADTTPPAQPTAAIVRKPATVIGYDWRGGGGSARDSDAPEVEVEGEFVSTAPPEHGAGGHGAGTTGSHASVARWPGGELAVLEPTWSSPPLPPWIHVRGPRAERSPSRDLVLISAPNGVAAQQFRTLRYRIEQEAASQVIAVISPRSNEGRSVTAANVALALAEGGRVKVLLIDASLRSASQAKLFGLDDDVGLTTTLVARQRDPLAPLPLTQIRRGLFVLTAGPAVGSPHAALASEAAAHLLGALRRSFRYIVVDASPVFGPAETLAWHGMIDSYVMVARRGHTSTDDLHRAAERIGRDKILGVTFVGAARRTIAS